MGVSSYGDIDVDVTNEYGSIQTMHFFRPQFVPTYITINIKPLAGYTTEAASQIKQSIMNYYTSLYIGDNLYNSQLWEAALSVSPDIRQYFSIDPTKGITIGTQQGQESLQDLTATFKQKFTMEEGNITINTGA